MSDPFAENMKIIKFKHSIDKLETWEEIEKFCRDTFRPPVENTIPRISDSSNPYSYRPSDYRPEKIGPRTVKTVHGICSVDNYHLQEQPSATKFNAIRDAFQKLSEELYSKEYIKISEYAEPMNMKTSFVVSLEVVVQDIIK